MQRTLSGRGAERLARLAARARGRRRGQEDAGADARLDRRDSPAQGRRDRRLRDYREHAPLLHPEDSQPQDAGPAANRDLRAVRDHRGRETGGARIGRIGRRARGLPDRGADGGRDRRRPADYRADRQHDRRYRRRHHRSRGHLAGGRGLLALGQGGRRQDGRGDHPAHQAQVQSADRRAHRRADQDHDRVGLPRRRDPDHGDQGARSGGGRSQDHRDHRRGDPRGADGAGASGGRVGANRARTHAARIGLGYRRQGNRARRRRRAASQSRRAAARGDGSAGDARRRPADGGGDGRR